MYFPAQVLEEASGPCIAVDALPPYLLQVLFAIFSSGFCLPSPLTRPSAVTCDRCQPCCLLALLWGLTGREVKALSYFCSCSLIFSGSVKWVKCVCWWWQFHTLWSWSSGRSVTITAVILTILISGWLLCHHSPEYLYHRRGGGFVQVLPHLGALAGGTIPGSCPCPGIISIISMQVWNYSSSSSGVEHPPAPVLDQDWWWWSGGEEEGGGQEARAWLCPCH